MDIRKFFNKYKHIHFIGIGGISMSALAKLCLNNGIKVSGSNNIKTAATEELEHLGVKIDYSHKKENITNPNLVVYTCAISNDNPELIRAKENCKVMERSVFCGELTKLFENVIAIAGTHGKTTTTGMITSIFCQANLNPTALIGGDNISTNGNLKIGTNNFLIIEACEYKEHFLNFEYDVGIITNIEYDHPDYYKTETDMINSFVKFATKAKKLAIVNEQVNCLIPTNNKITCSISSNANFIAQNIRINYNLTEFDVYKNNQYFYSFSIQQFGVCNVFNALFSICVADYYKIDKQIIYDGLINFKGIKRRQQYLGKLNNNLVYLDYAHHPTEISSVIKAFHDFFKRDIVVIFQPHTYSRTKALMGEFIKALKNQKSLILLPTYPAREKPIKNGSSRTLYNNLRFTNKYIKYMSSKKKILSELKKYSNSIILFVGAGDIDKLAWEIILSK